MEIREYANAIARELENKGFKAEVNDFDKANGVVMTGVAVKSPENNVGIVFYIDKFFDDGIDPKVAADNAQRLYEQNIAQGNEFASGINEKIRNYESIKEMLTVRLYNKATKVEVFRSASRYGFDDLILVPVINIQDDASIKVNNAMLKDWGVTKAKVFSDAMKNTKEDIMMESLTETLKKLMGTDLPIHDGAVDDILVVSNKSMMFGASAIIGALPGLKKKLTEGFSVLPSSVHEVLVVPNTVSDDAKYLTYMVQEVNSTQVPETERLSDKAYTFA